MALVQLHWQWIEKGETMKTEMIAQKDRSDIPTHEEFGAWVKEITEKHPPPKGAIWMVCEENSKYFALAKA